MIDTTTLRAQIDELERRQIFTAPLVRELIDEIDNVRTERDALSAYVVAQSDEIERLRKLLMQDSEMKQMYREACRREHDLEINNIQLRDAFSTKAMDVQEAHKIIQGLINTLEECGMVVRTAAPLSVPI